MLSVVFGKYIMVLNLISLYVLFLNFLCLFVYVLKGIACIFVHGSKRHKDYVSKMVATQNVIVI